MINHSAMKLGRKAIKTDSRTLRVRAYLSAELPPAPPAVDWTKGIPDWGMMLNDRLGCCTIAGVAHAIQVWTANESKEATVLDKQILSYYENGTATIRKIPRPTRVVSSWTC